MSNLELYNKVRVVPKEAQKEIQAGRLKGMTDINPMWRIKILTEQFGICGIGWKTEIVSEDVMPGANGEMMAKVRVNLYIRTNGEWSDAISGTGGSMLVVNEKNGPRTNDEAFKMAYTDALSVCCKALGIGADIYFAKDRTKYSDITEPIKYEPKSAPTPVVYEPSKDIKCEICKKAITPFEADTPKGHIALTPEDVAKRNKAKYGIVCCADCAAKKAKSEEK